MEKKLGEIKLTFSLFKTLLVMKEDKTMSNVLNQKYKMSANALITAHKSGLLGKDTIEYIKGMFYSLIIKSEKFSKMYADLDLPAEDSKFDLKETPKQKRRITIAMLEEKRATVGLTESERLIYYSILLEQNAVRLHTLGKREVATDKEARQLIGNVQQLLKQTDIVLSKYGPSSKKRRI